MIEVIRSESMEFIPVGWYIAICSNEYLMFFNKPFKKKLIDQYLFLFSFLILISTKNKCRFLSHIILKLPYYTPFPTPTPTPLKFK